MLTQPKYLLSGYSDYSPAVTDSEEVLRSILSEDRPEITVDLPRVLRLGLSSQGARTHLSGALAALVPHLASNGHYAHNVCAVQTLEPEQSEIACTPRTLNSSAALRLLQPQRLGQRLTGPMPAWCSRLRSDGEVVVVDAPIGLDRTNESYCLRDFPPILAKPDDVVVYLAMSSSVQTELEALLGERKEWYPLTRAIGIVEEQLQPTLRLLQVQIRRPQTVLSGLDELRTEANQAAAYIEIMDKLYRQELASSLEFRADEEKKSGLTFKQALETLRNGSRTLYLNDLNTDSWKKVEANPFAPGIDFWLGLAYLIPDWPKERSGIDFHTGKELLRTYRKQFNANWMKGSRLMEILSWVHLTRRGTHLLRKRLERVLTTN